MKGIGLMISQMDKGRDFMNPAKNTMKLLIIINIIIKRGISLMASSRAKENHFIKTGTINQFN